MTCGVGFAYPAQEAFLVINRHAQRILLPGAIFFWEGDDGPSVMISNALDAEWLLAQANADEAPDLE